MHRATPDWANPHCHLNVIFAFLQLIFGTVSGATAPFSARKPRAALMMITVLCCGLRAGICTSTRHPRAPSS